MKIFTYWQAFTNPVHKKTKESGSFFSFFFNC